MENEVYSTITDMDDGMSRGPFLAMTDLVTRLEQLLSADREAVTHFLENRHRDLVKKLDSVSCVGADGLLAETVKQSNNFAEADVSLAMPKTCKSAPENKATPLPGEVEDGQDVKPPIEVFPTLDPEAPKAALSEKSFKNNFSIRSKSTADISVPLNVAGFFALTRRAAESQRFELTFAALIILNALVMCFEAQYWGYESGYDAGAPGMTRPADDVWPHAKVVFNVLDVCFGFAFTCEVLLKLAGLRMRFVWSFWNWFDTFIIASWIVYTLYSGILPVNPFTLRIVRIIRLVRLLRLVRTLQVFDVLHLMVASLSASVSVLLWSVVFLIGIMMSAALVMISLVSFYISDSGNPKETRIEAHFYFGNFSKAFLSMFELTLGNWVPITRFLNDNVSEWFGVALMAYHCVISFAVVMVIRGIFLHETFNAASQNDDLMILRQHRAKMKTIEKISGLFEEADDSGDGNLSHAEFMEVMSDPRVKTWLAAMGLEMRDAEVIFDMVDDGDHQISAPEFVAGLTRLKGPARSLDVVQVLRMARAQGKLLQDVCGRLGLLCKSEDLSVKSHAMSSFARIDEDDPLA